VFILSWNTCFFEQRDERALNIDAIVEKWWSGKIKKVARHSEKLRKEVGSEELEERQMEELWNMRRQERLAIQILSEREGQRERSPQEVGQEGEGVDIREEEDGMNIEEEREDSTPMIGYIGNPIKEIIQMEENETPQIKENCLEPSGASPKSPIPQVSSIQVVSSILSSHTSFVLV
jgi:hypothetical protein